MNDAELAANKQLSSYDVHDLNSNPVLPYEDESFDVITNVVSVDYLAKPLQLFEEMHRVMKPSGLAIMSFSNRMFWSVSLSNNRSLVERSCFDPVCFALQDQGNQALDREQRVSAGYGLWWVFSLPRRIF